MDVDVNELPSNLQPVRIKLQGKKEFELIPRAKLTLEFLRDHYGGAKIDLLYEERTGDIIWPAKWIFDCSPAPTVYVAHLEDDALAIADTLADFEYRGETAVVAIDVPDDMSEEMLRSWLTTGLEDEQPDLKSARVGVAELAAKLDAIENQIALLPNAGTDGASSANEELQARRRRAEVLQQMKLDTEGQIKLVQERLERIKKDGGEDSTAFKLRHIDSAAPFSLHRWELIFPDTPNGAVLAYCAVNKKDWPDYYCLVHPRDRSNLRIGKGAIPPADETGGMTAIGTRPIQIKRVRHGRGAYHFGALRGVYSGDFYYGFAHGVGTMVNARGRLQGRFEAGHEKGECTMVYSRGDTLRATVAALTTHRHTSLLGGDEYILPSAQEEGTLHFVDGSVYEGGLRNGAPCGAGKYLDVTGGMREGSFDEWGMLTGDSSTSAEDLTCMGTFKRGVLEGYGTELDMMLGTYSGDFWRGLRHGMGRFKQRNFSATYIGGYSIGERAGRGLFDYTRENTVTVGKVNRGGASTIAGSKPPPPRSQALVEASEEQVGGIPKPGASVAPAPDDGAYRVEGRFLADRIRSGGLFSARNGSRDPIKFSLSFTLDGNCYHLPALDDIFKEEEALLTERARKLRMRLRAVQAQRAKQETTNYKRFESLSKSTKAGLAHFYKKNVADRKFLDEIELTIKTKKAAAERERLGLSAEEPKEGEAGGGAKAAAAESGTAGKAR